MEIIPAIDLRGGKCVRLWQGDYQQMTVYGDDPVAVARRWVEAGATRLHLVDLDGAASGLPINHAAISDIIQTAGVPVQVGGGIRTLDTAEDLIRRGADRIIFGTAAVTSQEIVREACARFCGAVVVGIDARDGRVATRGWLDTSEMTAAELARAMAVIGVQRFVYTDIARDGTLTGPNLAATAALVAQTGAAIIASGGVSSLADVAALRQTGVEAVVVGKALYTGAFRLEDALDIARTQRAD